MPIVMGIAMVKDEADIIQATIGHMLTQVDHVIVADNGSTDGTREILSSFPITVIDDPDPAYYQSKKMTNLAKVAKTHGADWVVPFDADEIWYSKAGTLKDALTIIDYKWLAATAKMFDHVTSSEDDLTELNPIKRIGWRRDYSGMLPKVACRVRDDLVIQQGNHGVLYKTPVSYKEGFLEIRHFPYRSGEQFCRKAKNGLAAYQATDLPENQGAHWRGYGAILRDSGEQVLIDEVYKTWFHLNDPRTLEQVVYDPAPIVV